MGQEFAQINEWSESRGLDWWLTDNPNHDGVMACVARLNAIYQNHPALWSDDFTNRGFEWIDCSDGDNNVLSYLRKSAIDDDIVAVVCNFSGSAHENYRVGLPFGGQWTEILNTDALEYGGSGFGNLGVVTAEATPWNGRSYSAAVQLPALGVIYLTPKK